MNTPDKPKRMWWRKRRWWLAGLFWLLVTYPLSVGPLSYLEARFGLPQGFWLPYVPLVAALEQVPELRDATIVPYLQWWADLALRRCVGQDLLAPSFQTAHPRRRWNAA